MDNIQNILLDFDGTLNDTHFVFISNLNGLLGMDGKTLYYAYLNNIHREIVHEKYPERHDDVEFHWRLFINYYDRSHDSSKIEFLTACFRKAEAEVFEKPKLFPEVKVFLDSISEAEFHLCLSTGGDNSSEKIETIFRILGRNYFENALDEKMIGHLKHKPSYYREALKRLDWEAKNTISIGDTILTDVYPAKNVGIRTIWINRRNEGGPIDKEMMPNYEVNNLVSALDFLVDEQK
jgi:FMN phosphatase YigB (HAD superfamily)